MKDIDKTDAHIYCVAKKILRNSYVTLKVSYFVECYNKKCKIGKVDAK